MKIEFKKYQKNNFKEFDQCLVQLQDFLVKMDPLKRLRKAPNYSPQYAIRVVEEVKKYEGAIFLAIHEGKVVGCIVGIVQKQTKKNLLDHVPTKTGRVVELIVLDGFRGLGIGKRLMEKMEDYMRKQKCDMVRVEVFEPNADAHLFYKKLKYQDRMVDLIKLL